MEGAEVPRGRLDGECTGETGVWGAAGRESERRQTVLEDLGEADWKTLNDAWKRFEHLFYLH
jgi:hypothetical protein